MTSLRSRTFFGFATLTAMLVTSTASAQWRYHQPWRLARDSHQSRVVSCDDATPYNRVAWDDWHATEEAKLVVVEWWGVLTNADAQEMRGRYRLAIASHNEEACLPETVIYEACVRPRFRYAGTDCKGESVYRFRARIPGGFIQQEGEHYWLSIAEDDAGSAWQGEEDFRWSGFRPPRFCHAAQRRVDGTWIQPLLSECDDLPNDLAFCLYSRGAIGQGPVQGAATIDLYYGDSGLLAESLAVEIDDDGEFLLAPDVPDGTYEAVMRIPGRVPASIMIELTDGELIAAEWGDLPTGDLDGDGKIGFGDLLLVLTNWTGE